jgi:nifR3 family TIM-barrel protein
MKNFWATLPKPFFVLAPMADVTDAAFRRVIAKYSKPNGPHVMYTEFVSADGICRAPEEGRNKLMRDLLYTEAERPIVAQFFTSTPEYMEKVAALAQELGFDGIDINMGCPDKSIEKQGAGAKLITNPERAKELVAAAKRGAPNLPVSVKTRLGYNTDILEEWLPKILEAEPASLILHARTRKEMSLVDAHWDRVKRAVEIRNEVGSKALIVGNGDVKDIEEAKQKAKETGADGIMIGRGIFGKPWLFSETDQKGSESAVERDGAKLSKSPAGYLRYPEGLISERLQILVEHTKLYEELLGDIKSFAIMKKHFKAYVEGFDGAKELRVQLMEAKNAAEVETFIETFIYSM